jgi:MFS family permease
MPHLFRNAQYMKLLFVAVLVMAAFNSLQVNMESWLKPFAFHSSDVSILSSSSTVCSIVSIILSVIYIRRYRKFKATIIGYLVLGMLACAATAFSLYLEKLGVLVVLSSLSAFALFPVIPTIIELACELVYPIGEVFFWFYYLHRQRLQEHS